MLTTILFISVFIVLSLVFNVCDGRRRRAFEERFPPLCDAEFVARCAAGTSPEVALKVRKIFAEILCVEYERIDPSSRLIDDLGAD